MLNAHEPGDEAGFVLLHPRQSYIGGRPAASVVQPQGDVRLLHTWDGRPQDVQLLLEDRALTSHLLLEAYGSHMTAPGGRLFTALCCLIHDRKLPEVAQENQARQLVRVLPQCQDVLKVGSRTGS